MFEIYAYPVIWAVCFIKRKVKMDAVSHLALGVCTSELWLRKKADKRILIWGAAAQVLPDIDTVPALYLPADRSLMIHRGITHSLFFAVIAGLVLALLAFGAFRPKRLSFLALFFFLSFQLLLHDGVDLCNSYGTGLLEPFSHSRFSFNLLYVADPVFTAGLLVAAIVLVFKSSLYAARSVWAAAALMLSACYISYAGINKILVSERLDDTIRAAHLHPKGYLLTPAPFNCMLWYAAIRRDSDYYTGYISVFDPPTRPVRLERHPENDSLLRPTQGRHAVQSFIGFADEYYTFSRSGGSLYINILRFGQIQGWRKQNAPFVLSCSLMSNGEGAAVLQKRRMAGWNFEAIEDYIRRIEGH